MTIDSTSSTQTTPPVAGLKANWKQFVILVVVNAFVGGMVGMERSIFAQFAETQFSISGHTALLSFIMAFGISKALANYFMGFLANRVGRKKLLVIGWLIALPVPFMLMWAKVWAVVVLANVLLGVSQGLTWSSTVIMKIDLAGERNRGLAMGLNEFAGYLAVGIVAYFTSLVANSYGVSPYPFYIGVGLAILGLFMSAVLVKDTRHFVFAENKLKSQTAFSNVFKATTLKDKALSSITQAGLINNMNDGMIWGLLPALLMQHQFTLTEVGYVTAIYPTVWGLGQIITGGLADKFSIKNLLASGMALQGMSIALMIFWVSFMPMAWLAALVGVGTAMVYPTFITGIAKSAPPMQRAESIGVFRFWRDIGYAVGALLSGLVADMLGVSAAIFFVGIITLASSVVIMVRMPGQV